MSESKNEVKPQSGDIERVVMLPLLDEETGHCSPSCPYKSEWEHPFYHHAAWCWKQMRDLGWYDYWVADCTIRKPDEMLLKIKHAGRTKAP